MRGRRIGAGALAGLLALPTPARAGDPRASEGPLAVEVAPRAEVAVPQDRAEETGPQGQAPAGPPTDAGAGQGAGGAATGASGVGTQGQVPQVMPEGPAPPGAAPGAGTSGPPPPTAALQEPEDGIAVAVGLGPSAPGSRAERAIVDALERSARASTAPRASVRWLRPGAGEGPQLCRERQGDLVILVEYLPDRPDPVLLPQDCRTGRALGVRGAEAAEHPELVAALWAEHEELVRQGAQERRRGRLGPKVRTGLIAGGAILAIGVAIGVVVAASLRRETVVLTVSP